MFQFETEKDQWSQGTKELLDADNGSCLEC
jgi:hypothetical protein